MEYSEILSLLEKTVKIPHYTLLGNLKGTPLYVSTEQGEISLFALSKKSKRLTKGAISDVARPKPNADYVPFIKDLSHGKEVHSLNITNLKGEESEVSNPGARITSLSYDKNKIAFTSHSGGSGGVFLVEGGETRKLAEISPFSSVADIGEKLVIGSGVLKGNPRAQELFSVSLSGGKPDIFTPREGSVNHAFEVDNDHIYFTSDFETDGEASRLYKYHVQERKYERVEFSGADLRGYNPTEIYSFEHASNLLIGGKDGETKIFKDGKLIKSAPGVVSGVTAVNGIVFFSHSSLVSTPKIFRIDKTGQINTVVSNKRLSVGKVEYKKIKTDVSVPTWLIRPKNGGNRIGVVYVHGGPWYAEQNSWNIFVTPFVLAGYTNIIPNFRGSTGYGNRFMQMDINDAGGGDLRDVIAARDYLVKNKLVDHVGIAGASYGGFMTFLATVKYPELWEFGIAEAGVTDWEEMDALSDPFFKTFIGLLFGGDKDLMKDRSAKNFVKNVKVPLCIVHSQNDSRTPLMPVLKYAQELQSLNRRFEMHVIPDMGHSVTSVKDAVDLIFPAFTFLKRLYG